MSTQHTAQALASRQNITVITISEPGRVLVSLSMLNLVLKTLRRVEGWTVEPELRERLHVHNNGLDGIIACFQRKAEG